LVVRLSRELEGLTPKTTQKTTRGWSDGKS
jgi:hypothetical protein